MTLGAEHYSELGPEGIAAIGDGEPLLPGETVTLDWAHPSRDAELLVHADSPLGEWEVVIALSWKPEHVEVTARSDGGLDVRSPGRSDVIAPPTAAPQIDWQPRSARQAAVALLKAADRFQRSLLSIETLCAAIDPVVQPALGVPLSALPVPYHPDVKDPCLVAASFALYGGENSPIPLSTRHHGLAVRVHGNRAVFSTTFTRRYQREDGVPGRLILPTRVLLARDPGGIWRLGTLEPLLPLYALDYRRPASDRELARMYRRDRQLGARERVGWERETARTRNATVQATATPPCTAAPVTDGQADVAWNGPNLARRQQDHLDVDLVAGGVSGNCVMLRTAAPLPGSFTATVGFDKVEIDVSNGKVVAYRYTDFGEFGDPIPGIAASLAGTDLLVRLPEAISRVEDIELYTPLDDPAYGDSVDVG